MLGGYRRFTSVHYYYYYYYIAVDYADGLDPFSTLFLSVMYPFLLITTAV